MFPSRPCRYSVSGRRGRRAKRDALVFAVLPLVWAGLCLGGCSSDKSSGGATAGKPAATAQAETSPKQGGRLVVGLLQEPERLNEILHSTATNNLICNLIFGKFVRYDDRLRLHPDLIEEIPTVANGGISSDYMTYTYRLRPDARWHDGRPISSRDVVFTYEVIMDPAIAVESREGWDVIASVETPDDRTVVFRLKEPYPDFAAETFLDEPVLPAHILGGSRGRDFQASDFHRAPVGCGPFRFKEWVPGSHLVLARSDRYHGEGPYLDEIIFKFVPNEHALLVQLETGEIDLLDNAGATLIERARDLRGIRVYATPTLMYEHIDLNTEHPVLRDRRVRQALALATDRDAIARDVYGGHAEPAPLDEHPSSRFYSESSAAKSVYDPPRARKLLHDAGWHDRDGDGILEREGRDLVLFITATAGNLDREKCEVLLQGQYREVGVDLRIRNYSPTVLYGSYEDGGILKRGKFDLAMYAWLSSPEPASKAALYASDRIPPAGQNHPRIRHARLTELLERGSRETDPAERERIYQEASLLLVEEAPVIPLFWYTAIDLCREGLANYAPNPTQSADSWNANLWYWKKEPSLSMR